MRKAGSNESNNEYCRKPFMWLHPPKNIELTIHDELFVLSDKNQSVSGDDMARQYIDSSKIIKNEEKKTQENNINLLKDLNGNLQEMLQSTAEFDTDINQSSRFIKKDFKLKLRSDLDGLENFA